VSIDVFFFFGIGEYLSHAHARGLEKYNATMKTERIRKRERNCMNSMWWYVSHAGEYLSHVMRERRYEKDNNATMRTVHRRERNSKTIMYVIAHVACRSFVKRSERMRQRRKGYSDWVGTWKVKDVNTDDVSG
jgi:hypothetical protein